MKSKLRQKGKRLLTIAISMLILFGMSAPGMHSFAEGRNTQVDVTITEFNITSTDHTVLNTVYYSDTFLLKMKWDASANGANLHQGDFFDITLPNNMRFPSGTTASDFDLTDEDGNVIAKAHVTPGPGDVGGTVHVVFTDAVENKYNVKGTMYLAAKFAKTGITYGEENTFTVTVNGNVAGQSSTASTGVVINGPKPVENEYINKWGGKVNSSDHEVAWHARINHLKTNMNNAVITDTLGDSGETFIADSFVLYKVKFDQYANITEVISTVDITGKLTILDGGKTFRLDLGNVTADEQYSLEYKSTYTPGTTIKNKLELDYENIHQVVVASYHAAASGGTAGGDLASKIKLTKVDAEDSSILLAGVTFTVTRPNGTTFELTTGADGTVTSGVLEQGTYKVKETAALPGYELNEEEFTLVVSPQGGALQTITNKPIKIDISGTKTWDDGNNQDGKRPEKITVNLLKNGSPFKQAEVKPDADGNWKYSFNDLRQYENGEKINYTVTEDTVAEYTPTVDGYNIKNSYTPKKTSVTVSKCWNDGNNQDGKRPNSVKVQLYGDGDKVGDDIELNGGNSWTYTWTDLPEKKEGKTIKYTVQEVGTTEGYTTTQNDQNQGNIIITNKHVPEKIEVKGEKTWNDADNQDGKRPEKINVNLLADGVEVAEAEVKPDADGNWKYSFADLDKYKDGKEIVYTVTEDAVEGYTPSFEGFNIKNSYTPEEISVTVTKGWNDADDQDGKRPKSIKVQLYGDDEKVGGEVELSNDISWTHTWTGLPKKAKGKDIKYTVQEVGKIEGYTTTVDGSNIGNINILNSHTPEVTKVEGKKTWNDSDNQDGKRPESITVNLLADGKKVDEKTVTKDDNWKYSFENLPKYKEGKEIVYTVTENTVEGYSVSIDGYDIKNSYTPKETTVTVTKCWNDSNDRDKMRPNSLKVQLYANGEKKGEAVELKEGSKWTHTWSKLPQKEKGKEIKYTVKEVGSASGYTVTIDDKNHGNIIITNTHTPKEISGPKTGDTNNLMLYIILLLVSASAIAGLFVARKRIMR